MSYFIDFENHKMLLQEFISAERRFNSRIFWKQTLDGPENRCRLPRVMQLVVSSVLETNSSFVLFNERLLAI